MLKSWALPEQEVPARFLLECADLLGHIAGERL
jgi:hypothetical protein